MRIRMPNRAVLGAVVIISPVAAAAQDAAVELEPIVVTGGRTPIPVDAYGRAYSVITAEEIEQRQIRYVADALRAVPGVSVSRAGSYGGLSQIRLRGAESNHTLVLIDGIEVSSPEQGEYDFGGLLATDIERIEVLRGPQSSLYGSNAIGGVISIITKDGSAGGGIGGTVEGAADGSYLASAHIRGANANGHFSLSGAFQKIGGFDVSDDPGGQDDEDRNVTLNAKGKAFAADWLTVGGGFRLADRDSDYDLFNFGAVDRADLVTDADLASERREIFATVFAEMEAFDGRLEHGPTFAYSRADFGDTSDGAPTSDQTSDRLKAAYQATLGLDAETVEASDHSLTLAAEWERESFVHNDPALVFDPSQLETQSRELYGFVGEYRGSFFDALDIQVGLRQDVNDAFEDATTYSAGASYRVAATASRLHASVGTGVQNPTLIEQFGFTPASFQGNPDLTPEKSFGWDVGVEQRFWSGRLVADVTYFEQTLEDEIATDFSAATPTPFNQDGESDRRGVEVAATFLPTDQLSFDLAYTWLDAENPDGSVEVRRPEHEGRIGAAFRFNDGDSMLRADARFVAGNYDTDFTAASFGADTIRLDDYVVVDIAASHRLTEAFEIYGRVNNLLDTDYEELDGYATEGVNGALGIRAEF